jgi:hypothetical protein
MIKSVSSLELNARSGLNVFIRHLCVSVATLCWYASACGTRTPSVGGGGVRKTGCFKRCPGFQQDTHFSSLTANPISCNRISGDRNERAWVTLQWRNLADTLPTRRWTKPLRHSATALRGKTF